MCTNSRFSTASHLKVSCIQTIKYLDDCYFLCDDYDYDNNDNNNYGDAVDDDYYCGHNPNDWNNNGNGDNNDDSNDIGNFLNQIKRNLNIPFGSGITNNNNKIKNFNIYSGNRQLYRKDTNSKEKSNGLENYHYEDET